MKRISSLEGNKSVSLRYLKSKERQSFRLFRSDSRYDLNLCFRLCFAFPPSLSLSHIPLPSHLHPLFSRARNQLWNFSNLSVILKFLLCPGSHNWSLSKDDEALKRDVAKETLRKVTEKRNASKRDGNNKTFCFSLRLLFSIAFVRGIFLFLSFFLLSSIFLPKGPEMNKKKTTSLSLFIIEKRFPFHFVHLYASINIIPWILWKFSFLKAHFVKSYRAREFLLFLSHPLTESISSPCARP